MDWDWAFAWEILPNLLKGAVITIQATFLGMAVALVFGLLLTILRRSHSRLLSGATRFFVDFIRGTPLLVQLYFLFYVLPDIGILLPPMVAGVIGLGLHYSTYISEVYRSGIDNTPRGQWEAAKACNLTTVQTWRYVILPQALPPVIPALANYLVAMFKETPLLSAITVVEIMSRAKGMADFNYRYLEPMTMVGAFFLLVSLASALVLRGLERRFAVQV
jgi:polar amino acid transport system permease protein